MHSKDNDNLILQRYVELANAIIVSSINDYCRLLVQQVLYPADQEAEMVKEEAGGNEKRLTYLRNHHERVRRDGADAYRFLTDEGRIKYFTSFSSDDLISFTKRKARMIIYDKDMEEARRQLRVGFKRNAVWRDRIE